MKTLFISLFGLFVTFSTFAHEGCDLHRVGTGPEEKIYVSMDEASKMRAFFERNLKLPPLLRRLLRSRDLSQRILEPTFRNEIRISEGDSRRLLGVQLSWAERTYSCDGSISFGTGPRRSVDTKTLDIDIVWTSQRSAQSGVDLTLGRTTRGQFISSMNEIVASMLWQAFMWLEDQPQTKTLRFQMSSVQNARLAEFLEGLGFKRLETGGAPNYELLLELNPRNP